MSPDKPFPLWRGVWVGHYRFFPCPLVASIHLPLPHSLLTVLDLPTPDFPTRYSLQGTTSTLLCCPNSGFSRRPARPVGGLRCEPVSVPCPHVTIEDYNQGMNACGENDCWPFWKHGTEFCVSMDLTQISLSHSVATTMSSSSRWTFLMNDCTYSIISTEYKGNNILYKTDVTWRSL